VNSPGWTCVRHALVLGWLAAGWTSTARAQTFPTPSLPPPAPVAAERAVASSEELLRELQLLRAQVNQLTKSQASQLQEIERLKAKLNANEIEAPPPAEGNPAARAPRSNATRLGFAGARDNVALPSTLPPAWGPRTAPVRTHFGPGFEIETLDSEFQLQVHNETQVDARIFGNEHEGVQFPNSGFYIPRERWYFMGRITKPIEYYTSTNQVFGTFNLLDAFLNFHYDDRLMLKVGRFKPPFPFEFYGLSNQDLIAPERSLFALNFGPGRQVAAMLWGELLMKRLGYGVAISDGQRNSYLAFHSGKDVEALVNFKPFQNSEGAKLLKHWNIGGSLDFGIENNPLNPNGFYTATTFPTNDPNALRASPTFLQFNSNVRERGIRELWSLHTALFYKHLSLLGGWNSGRNSYGLASNSTNTALPVQSFFVQAAYFLTGETVEGRTQVKPLRPFDLRKGKRGLGAIEVHARYASLNVGDQIFTAGFADPNLWSNQAYAIDTGWNWYLNQYVKLYFDWQHAEFGQPVSHGPNGFARTSNLYWVRFQLYF